MDVSNLGRNFSRWKQQVADRRRRVQVRRMRELALTAIGCVDDALVGADYRARRVRFVSSTRRLARIRLFAQSLKSRLGKSKWTGRTFKRATLL